MNGEGTSLQVVPLKCRSVSAPTAHTSLLPSAETDMRRLVLAATPEIELSGMMLQAVPSQCSIRAFSKPCSLRSPTAQTSFAEMAATALRLSPSTNGLLTSLQAVPSQCSINCSPKSGLLGPIFAPTAQTSLLAVPATPKNWPPGPLIPPLDKVGVGT